MSTAAAPAPIRDRRLLRSWLAPIALRDTALALRLVLTDVLHTAHHVDMSVPLYRLKAARSLPEARLPGRIVVQPFSWRWYAATARRCKLYAFEARCWTDFDGRPTSASAR